MSIKRKISVLTLLFLASVMMSQKKPAVYKIDDLMKRIHNSSDTIYVINFWATWCKPCVQELPEFEKLNSEKVSAGKKIKVLLVSMDFKENINDKLMPFLQKNKYTAEVVLLDEVDGNTFINKVNPKWSGAIPATYVTKRNKSKEEFAEKKLHYSDLQTILGGF